MTYQEIEQQILNNVLVSDNSYQVLCHHAGLEQAHAQNEQAQNLEVAMSDISLIEAIRACVDVKTTKDMLICKIGPYWDFTLQAMYHDIRV